MLLHIAEDTGEVFYCPVCKRELWPAYWSDEGLEVGIWSDFAPPEGQSGLLVCGNLNCTYEEAVTFTEGTTDAVVWNGTDTNFHFRNETGWGLPRTWLHGDVARIQRAFAETGRAKLHSALKWLQQEIKRRQERVDRWLAEAGKGYPVTFYAEEEELAGQILASHAEEFVLATPEGQVRELPKAMVWQEHIRYPSKPRKQRPGDERILFVMRDREFIVVGGYHLGYGEPTDLGGYYRARCWDAEVAAALRLRQEAPGYWAGAFRAEEIERFYWRRNYVKIRGYWLEEVERNDEHRVFWASTKDPAVAKALDMGPVYSQETGEFGGYDGDVVAYDDHISLDEIQRGA